MTKKIDYKKWHSGPPPSVGWWPASLFKDNGVYRWWDGEHWSHPAFENYSGEAAAEVTNRNTKIPYIFWQHRPASWPARSRT